MLGVLILAGGKGNRIRGNKPLITLGGKMLISYVIDVAFRLSEEVIVALSQDKNIEQFQRILPEEVKITMDTDIGEGPLSGVYSGLKEACSEYAFVLPCDSPFINTELMTYLLEKCEDFDAAIPRWPNGYMEPLHSVYRVESALRACQKAMITNSFRLYTMIQKLDKVTYLPIEKLKRFDPELFTFFNINNDKDLKQAEKILNRIKKED